MTLLARAIRDRPLSEDSIRGINGVEVFISPNHNYIRDQGRTTATMRRSGNGPDRRSQIR